MNYYKTTIRYDGTHYAGFQWQNGIQTVQSEFNNAVEKVVNGKFSTMAASRTDTGVHAMEQVVKLTTVNPIDSSLFVETFNKALPPQIRCLKLQSCSGEFKPAGSALSKEYRYFFTNKSQVAITDQQFIANISNKLNVENIMICVQALAGVHDFCNFYSSGSNVKSTVRNVFLCELSIINPQDIFSNLEIFPSPVSIHECYQLKIEANGFLKQMIRHIVSALWMVGSGKMAVDDFIKLIHEPKKNKQMWKVAPPNGLFLYRINYPNQD